MDPSALQASKNLLSSSPFEKRAFHHKPLAFVAFFLVGIFFATAYATKATTPYATCVNDDNEDKLHEMFCSSNGKVHYNTCFFITPTHKWDKDLQTYVRVNKLMRGFHQEDAEDPAVTFCDHTRQEVYIRYTPYVSCALFLCALICLAPVAASWVFEKNKVNIIVAEMKHASVNEQGMVNFLLKVTNQILYAEGDNKTYVALHHGTPLLYLFAFVIVFGSLHLIFLNRFFNLPYDLIVYCFTVMDYLEPLNSWYSFLLDSESPNPMRQIFPTNGVCSITTIGTSGEDNLSHSMCTMEGNLILYTFALPIWFLLSIGTVMAFGTFVLHMLPFLYPPLRPWLLKREVRQKAWKDAETLANRLPYSDFRFLLMLRQELLRETFTQLVTDLSSKVFECAGEFRWPKEGEQQRNEAAYLDIDNSDTSDMDTSF